LRFLSAWLFIEWSEAECFFSVTQWRIFIEFCQHEVPALMPCRMEANSFADSWHGNNDAGRSPRQNVFLFFLCITIVIKFTDNDQVQGNFFSALLKKLICKICSDL